MMRKSIFNAAGILLLTAGLAAVGACSSGTADPPDQTTAAAAVITEVQKEAPEKDAASQEAKEPEMITLKLFANYSADQEIRTLDYALEKVKEEMPHIMVEIEPVPQDDGQKLKTYAASGNLPDVFKSDGVEIENFNKSGELVILDDYVRERNIEDSIVDSYKAALYMPDGHIYAVPWQSPWVLSFYANRKVFEDNKVPIPTNYDEFLLAVKQFKEKGVLPYALFGKEKAFCLHLYDIMVTREAPEGIAALDRGEAIVGTEPYKKAAQKLIELVEAGLLSQDVFNTTYDQAESLFISGNAAMFMTGTWALNTLEQRMGDNVVLLYYPLADAGKEEAARWNMSGGYGQGGFSVPAYSKHKEEAARFAVLLSQKLNEAFVVLEGGASIYKDAPASGDGLGPIMQAYIADNAKFKSMSAFDWNLTNQELKTFMEDKSQELLTGQLSAEDFAAEMDEAINETRK